MNKKILKLKNNSFFLFSFYQKIVLSLKISYGIQLEKFLNLSVNFLKKITLIGVRVLKNLEFFP